MGWVDNVIKNFDSSIKDSFDIDSYGVPSLKEKVKPFIVNKEEQFNYLREHAWLQGEYKAVIKKVVTPNARASSDKVLIKVQYYIEELDINTTRTYDLKNENDRNKIGQLFISIGKTKFSDYIDMQQSLEKKVIKLTFKDHYIVGIEKC